MTDEAVEEEGGTISVAAPPPKEEEQKDGSKRKPRKAPRYHVVLWDDQDHTYEYVIAMLGTLFGKTREEAFQYAQLVDREGKVIVTTTALEVAELKRDQIHAFGKDELIASCKGSMSATIEKAPE